MRMPDVISGQENAHRSLRILRRWELRERKGIDYSDMHLGRLEKAGQFPRRFKLGKNSVGWLEHEVDAWIAEKPAARTRPKSNDSDPAPAKAA
jgi:prophage regulatory protein